MDYAGSTLFIGAGATLAMDLWTLARRRLFGTPLADYGLVGRWIGHMARGQFRHERIAAAPPVRGERVIGWTAHYLTGIAFAGVLLATCGLGWARQPTLGPAVAFGIATVAAPFLLMQPGMGAGIAASRTPRPSVARAQSLVTHAVFGLGLYAAGLFLNFLSGE
jgi:hypothetical protein